MMFLTLAIIPNRNKMNKIHEKNGNHQVHQDGSGLPCKALDVTEMQSHADRNYSNPFANIKRKKRWYVLTFDIGSKPRSWTFQVHMMQSYFLEIIRFGMLTESFQKWCWRCSYAMHKHMWTCKLSPQYLFWTWFNATINNFAAMLKKLIFNSLTLLL